jgi:tRNA (mo5U34)-methyltransferase
VAEDLHAQRAVNPVKEGLDRTGLYHSIRLPSGEVLEGAMPLAYQEDRWSWFGLPEDLSGKRALDVGPWDGYFTFELERHGAEVTSIDYADLDTFRKLHALFGSHAKYINMDVYDVTPERLGHFDIVLLLGVLYHLKHPLLALERICAITRDVCIVDTYVVDPKAYVEGTSSPIPYAEFYERGELGGQLDNWCGPTVSQVQAWIRTAGFARADVLRVTSTTVCVRASRHWGDLPPVTAAPTLLYGVNSPSHGGRCFLSQKEEYLVFWCQWTSDAAPALETVFPEVDGYGVSPIFSRVSPTGLMITTRLPPGLTPGRHEARLRIGSADWSNIEPIYVDIEDLTGTLAIVAVQDAITFSPNEVDWANGGWVTVWVNGLAELVDFGNVSVEVDGIPHRPQAIVSGQVNTQLRPLFRAGEHQVAVVHFGVRSNTISFTLRGATPVIKGFEALE